MNHKHMLLIMLLSLLPRLLRASEAKDRELTLKKARYDQEKSGPERSSFPLCAFHTVLSDPHYLPFYKSSSGEDFLSAKDREAYRSNPRASRSPYAPTSINPEPLCQETFLSPQLRNLVSLVMESCGINAQLGAQENVEEAKLLSLKSRVYDLLHDTCALPNANIIISTSHGLMPLLMYAINYSQSLDIVRLLAERSSDEMLTLAVNDRQTRDRIKTTELHNCPYLRFIKACRCPSPSVLERKEKP